MGSSLIINVLVYTYNGGLPVKSSIGLKMYICNSPNNTSGGLEVENVWFTHLVYHKKTTQCMIYKTMDGSPTINVMVYALFGGSPKLKV